MLPEIASGETHNYLKRVKIDDDHFKYIGLLIGYKEKRFDNPSAFLMTAMTYGIVTQSNNFNVPRGSTVFIVDSRIDIETGEEVITNVVRGNFNYSTPNSVTMLTDFREGSHVTTYDMNPLDSTRVLLTMDDSALGHQTLKRIMLFYAQPAGKFVKSPDDYLYVPANNLKDLNQGDQVILIPRGGVSFQTGYPIKGYVSFIGDYHTSRYNTLNPKEIIEFGFDVTYYHIGVPPIRTVRIYPHSETKWEVFKRKQAES